MLLLRIRDRPEKGMGEKQKVWLYSPQKEARLSILAWSKIWEAKCRVKNDE